LPAAFRRTASGRATNRTTASEQRQKVVPKERSRIAERKREPGAAGIERRSCRLGGRRGGEQIEGRVECVGWVDEPVGGVLAEAFDPLCDVRRQGSDSGRRDVPALRGELAQDGGHVQGGVEDHAVGEQRVELDDLLLLGGVVALDRVVPEPQPGGELVVGLDLVRRGCDLFAQFGLGDGP